VRPARPPRLVEEADVRERRLGHDPVFTGQQSVIETVALRLLPVEPLIGRDVLDVRDRSLVPRRTEVLGRCHLTGGFDGDKGGRFDRGLEDVDAERGILRVSEGVPDQDPNAFGVRADPERLEIGRFQPLQMQGDSARFAAADLHRREVAVRRNAVP
jgi:hypothetical protein